MYSSKNILEYILLITFEWKTAFSAIFKAKSVGNRLFSALFLCISAGMGAYLPPITPCNTTPCLNTPPVNSRPPKQFLSCPQGLLLFLNEGAELPTIAAA
jgi:hypothetical protein